MSFKAELAIWLEEYIQCAGVQVLNHAFGKILEEFGGCTMFAQVRTSHLASLSIFLGLGFQPVSLENHFLKLSKRIKLEN